MFGLQSGKCSMGMMTKRGRDKEKDCRGAGRDVVGMLLGLE